MLELFCCTYVVARGRCRCLCTARSVAEAADGYIAGSASGIIYEVAPDRLGAGLHAEGAACESERCVVRCVADKLRRHRTVSDRISRLCEPVTMNLVLRFTSVAVLVTLIGEYVLLSCRRQKIVDRCGRMNSYDVMSS